MNSAQTFIVGIFEIKLELKCYYLLKKLLDTECFPHFAD